MRTYPILAGIVFGLLAGSAAVGQQVWRESSYEDFRDGTFNDGGAKHSILPFTGVTVGTSARNEGVTCRLMGLKRLRRQISITTAGSILPWRTTPMALGRRWIRSLSSERNLEPANLRSIPPLHASYSRSG
jgi:hypothetical protein